MQLVSDEEFQALPDDPAAKWIALEALCRQRAHEWLARNPSSVEERAIRLQYMMTVSAAAEELGIPGVDYPKGSSPDSHFETFLTNATGASTRLRMRSTATTYSVRLAEKSRGRIEVQIARLRSIIAESDLPASRRAALLARLDELSSELSSPRVSFSRVMAILAYVSVGLGTTTAFLADAPEALSTITSIIGADKEAEVAEIKRIGAPPVTKALAPPPQADESSIDSG